MLLPFLDEQMAVPESWHYFCKQLRQHPIHEQLLKDPYTRRAYTKPRGYAGDAELIDFLYDRVPPSHADDEGQHLFKYTTSVSNAEAVRQRRRIAAEVLQLQLRRGGRICALACGHLREADGLSAEQLQQIVAVDQDGISLRQLRLRLGQNVETVSANALQFLFRNNREFSFIYALGLLDYLDDRAVEVLLRLAQRSLADGGTILVANFVPANENRSFMEAVMDWKLVLRDEADMLRLAQGLALYPRTFRDPTGNIVFLELCGASHP